MRILYLTHRVPYAPNRGDRVRTFHFLRSLSARHEVDVVCLAHDAEEAAHASEVASIARHVLVTPVPRLANRVRGMLALPTRRPLTHVLLHSPRLQSGLTTLVQDRRPDVLLVNGSGMASVALQPPLSDIPWVLDLVDVDSDKWRAAATHASPMRSWVYRREARYLAEFERRAVRAAAATLVVNERERMKLGALVPERPAHVVGMGIDAEFWRRPTPPSPSSCVVFCGVMNYEPNEVAAVWFGRHVWPLIREVWPDARFVIVGASPTRRVRALASLDGIEVTGTVADVRPYLWSAAAAVAPIHLAQGVQTKALEAMAAGVPVIATRAVADGLPPQLARLCTVADIPQAFAQAVVAALAGLASSRQAKAMEAAIAREDWGSRVAELDHVLRAACEGRHAA